MPGHRDQLPDRLQPSADIHIPVKFNGRSRALGSAPVSGIAVPVVNGSTTTRYAVGLLPDYRDGFLGVCAKN